MCVTMRRDFQGEKREWTNCGGYEVLSQVYSEGVPHLISPIRSRIIVSGTIMWCE